jgi:hypothetical protein
MSSTLDPGRQLLLTDAKGSQNLEWRLQHPQRSQLPKPGSKVAETLSQETLKERKNRGLGVTKRTSQDLKLTPN